MTKDPKRHPMLSLARMWSGHYEDTRKKMADLALELAEENNKLREEIRRLNDELVIEEEARRELEQ